MHVFVTREFSDDLFSVKEQLDEQIAAYTLAKEKYPAVKIKHNAYPEGIVEVLFGFDDEDTLLKFCNDLSGTMDISNIFVEGKMKQSTVDSLTLIGVPAENIYCDEGDAE